MVGFSLTILASVLFAAHLVAAQASGTSSSSPPTTTGMSGLPYLSGVNTAGYDFTVYTNGSFSGFGVDPPVPQFAHFANQGVKIFRIRKSLLFRALDHERPTGSPSVCLAIDDTNSWRDYRF